jgi:hypothetical protein
MSSRKFDSSKTRVVPVFDALFTQPAGWLGRLLDLAQCAPDRGRPWRGQDLTIEAHHCGARRADGGGERALQPPQALLEWLVGNLSLGEGKELKGSPDTIAQRQNLLDRHPETVAAALAALGEGKLGRAWHVLEGATYPDAFIETPDVIVVVEGKRTEPGPTTSTTWMAGRHQMLRHLDAAWEIRGNRSVYGLFIVEGDGESSEVPAVWREACSMTLSGDALSTSLPHRSVEERRQIASGFVGATTWQAVVAEFGLPGSVLRERADEGE